jgi:hypothetical protein
MECGTRHIKVGEMPDKEFKRLIFKMIIDFKEETNS